MATEDGYGKYPKIAYHNDLHGADVMHSVSAMFQAPFLLKIFSSLELLAMVIAGATHDVKHPGVNNQYMVVTSSDEALLYNDVSVGSSSIPFVFRSVMNRAVRVSSHLRT